MPEFGEQRCSLLNMQELKVEYGLLAYVVWKMVSMLQAAQVTL